MSTLSRPALALAMSSVLATMICLPSPALAQADQILPPIGGPGGGQFFARCPSPEYLHGFELRTGDDVDAIRPLCGRPTLAQPLGSRFSQPRSHGGTGGTLRELVCPQSAPVVNGIEVGYEGEKTQIVNTIHVYCSIAAPDQPLTDYPTVVFDGSEIRRREGGPLSGNTPVPLYQHRQICPRGLFAVGINGRSGIWLDSVGLICGLATVKFPEPKKPAPLTPCEAMREGRANNKPVPDWIAKQCIDSTAVVKQAERSAPIVTAGGTPAVVNTATLDELASRGEGIAARDPLSVELRNRAGEGAALRGFDIGMAAAEGQTHDGPGKQNVRASLSAVERQGFDIALAFSLQRNRHAKLAEVGAFIASADPVVAEARAGEDDVLYWLGFDIATGIFGDPVGGAQGNTATGPGSLGIRAALQPAAQRGFTAAMTLHLNRDYR
jgi:hypothetical protein